MQELKLTPEGLRNMSRRSVRIQLLTIGIAGTGYLTYLVWSNHGSHQLSDYLPVGIIVLLYGFLLYRGVQRSKKVLSDMTFLYDGTSITRKLATTRDVTIHFLEVSNVARHRKGLLLTGVTRQDQLWIPGELEHFPEIEARLAEFLPEELRKPVNKRRNTLLVILGLLPMLAGVAIFLLENYTALLIAGAVFVLTAPWLVYNLVRNKSATTGRKIGLIFVLVIMLLTLIVKLAGTGSVNDAVDRLFALFQR